MNNQTLVIYDFKILYQILTEIDEHISFNLINIKKISELNLKNENNFLIISNRNAIIVEIRTIITATNWIFRIAEFINILISEI